MINLIKKIRVHGRGGEDVVSAANWIAEAAMYDGKECRAFAVYGPARSGAPVQSFAMVGGEENPVIVQESLP